MHIAPKEHGDDDIPEPSDTAFVAEIKETVGEVVGQGAGSDSGSREVRGEEKASEVAKDESETCENPTVIGSPVTGPATLERLAKPADTITLGPLNSIAEQPSENISGNVVSTSALNPEKHDSSQAMALVDRPVPITEDHTHGVGLNEVAGGQSEGVSLTTKALKLIEGSITANETTLPLRICDVEVAKQVVGSEVDKVTGLLSSSVAQAHSASTLLSDGEADPASARVHARSPNVTSKSLLPARDDVLDTATLASTPTDENALPVDTSTIPSSLPPLEHVEIERARSPVAVGTTSEAPSSPLTELSSELDIDGRTAERSTRYSLRSGRHANAKGQKGKVFPTIHNRASSDESDSDGSGFSIDASSSGFSSPPVRLPFDRVVPPPLFASKELYRRMEGTYSSITTSNSENEPHVKVDPSSELMLMEDSLRPHAIEHAEPASNLLCPRPFEGAIAFDHLDCDDDGRDTQHGVTSNLRSGRLAHKRKRRQCRSRSRSPLHSYNEEEALALFGHNLTLYSVCGPPGGFPIGIGTLQCHPADGGRSSFNFYIEDEMQRLLAESMQTKVEESRASRSGAVPALSRLSKPQTAKRRETKKNIGSKASDMNNEDLANYSTCHACSRKTNFPKMKCSALRKSGTQCKLHFCDRCIERRFPGIQFDTQNLSFICPRCAGTCLCMMCKISRSKLPAELAKDEDDEENVMRDDTLTGSSTVENPAFNFRQTSLRKRSLKASTSTTLAALKDKMDESPVSGKVERATRTGKVADSISGVGLSSSTGRSPLSSRTLAKRPTTMQLATLKRKAVDDGTEDEALMPGTLPGEIDTSANSAIVSKGSRVDAKPVAKRARGPQIANLLRDNAPASDRRLCHQCRTRSTYAKMQCSAITDYGEMCQMTYCHRCIVNRYPGAEFTADGSFTCFRCSNQCNCDVCTRRRGEEFVTSANFKKAMSERLETSVAIPKSTPLTETTHLENTTEDVQCGANVPTDDEEAEEWIRSNRAGLYTAGKNDDNREDRYRAFVGDWQPSWGPMRSCVEMDGALLPTEDANGGSPISLRPHLYIGRPNTFQRSATPVNGTDETNNPLKSLPQSLKPQAKSLPNVRSRSGRIVKPSEKIRQYESGHEDELPFSSTRNKRSEATSSAAHDSASPSLSSITKTSTNERLSTVMIGSPLSDCATVDHVPADVSARNSSPSGAGPLTLEALSRESQLPSS